MLLIIQQFGEKISNMNTAEKLIIKLSDKTTDLHQFRKELIDGIKQLDILLKEKDTLIRKISHLEHSGRVVAISQLHDGPLQELNSKLILFKNDVSTLKSHEDIKIVSLTFASDIGEVIKQIREILKRAINSSIQSEQDFTTTLRELIRKRAYGTSVELNLSSDLNKTLMLMPPAITDLIIHFVQETMRNAHLHGNATEFDVSVQCNENNLILITRDNGCGFNCSAPKTKDEFQALADHGSLGLGMLFEMASPYSGKLRIKPKESTLGGAEIQLELPIPSEK